MTFKEKIAPLVGLVHKWAGLILFIQLLFWILGGVVMSISPIEKVRSEHLIQEPVQVGPLSLPEKLQLAALAGNPLEDLRRLEVKIIGGRRIAHYENGYGQTRLVDLSSGETVAVDEPWVRDIAAFDVNLAQNIEAATLIKRDPPIEYRGPLPVWRVDFDGPENLSLYIAPDDGTVISRRSDLWRLFDFFWMLHIMDYDERSDINNALLIWTAIAALLFTLTGLALLILRW